MNQAVPQIAVVRPDHLGDVLLTLPAIASLREAIPGAQITFVTPVGSTDAAGLSQDINASIGMPFPRLDQLIEGTQWPVLATLEADELRGRFDIAILPRPDDPWSGLLVSAADVPVRLGFDLPRTREFLTHPIPPPPREHVVITANRLVNAALAILGFGDFDYLDRSSSPRLRITREQATEAARAVSQVETESIVVLHPAAGWPLKHWGPERWGALALALRRDHGITPVVTGVHDDRALISSIVAGSDGSALDLSGQLSVGGLAALYQQAQLVIAIDSGPMHLAALLGTRVIGLYGPADPVQFAPWSLPGSQRIVRVPLPCSPCGNLLDPPCGARRDPACMTGIALTSVLTALDAMLTPCT